MITGTIKHWQLHTFFYKDEEVTVVSGYIWDDAKMRFPQGSPFRSSVILEIKKAGPSTWHLHTLNSVYEVDNDNRVDRSNPIVQERTFVRPKWADRKGLAQPV